MKNILIFAILLMVSTQAHAYTFEGCTKSDHGNWECKYNLKISGLKPPLNPQRDMFFGVTDPSLTEEQAKKITDKMAQDTEQPDGKAINKWIEEVKERQRLQKLAEKEASIKEIRDKIFETQESAILAPIHKKWDLVIDKRHPNWEIRQHRHKDNSITCDINGDDILQGRNNTFDGSWATGCVDMTGKWGALGTGNTFINNDFRNVRAR